MALDVMHVMDKEAERIASPLTEGTDGNLVFVSPNLLLPLMTRSKHLFFAATVAAFIINFLKKLPPDQTVPVLPDGTSSLTSSITAHQSSQITAVIRCAIVTWTISVMLSLTSALFAMMLQDWARRFVGLPYVLGDPHHRACLPSCPLQGKGRELRNEPYIVCVSRRPRVSYILCTVHRVISPSEARFDHVQNATYHACLFHKYAPCWSLSRFSAYLSAYRLSVKRVFREAVEAVPIPLSPSPTNPPTVSSPSHPLSCLMLTLPPHRPPPSNQFSILL
jgi:hypothetical protein